MKLDELKKQGKLCGWWDFRQKTLFDFSGNGNDLTSSGNIVWRSGKNGNGVFFKDTGLLTATDNASLNVTALTILIFADVPTQIRGIYYFDKYVCRFGVAVSGYPFILNRQTTVQSDGSVDCRGAKMIGVKYANGEVPQFYKNGSPIGSGTNSEALGSYAQNLGLGNFFITPSATYSAGCPFYGVVYANVKLSDQEISQIYNEFYAQTPSGNPKTTNYKWLNNPKNNEFAKDSDWVKGTNWTIANHRANATAAGDERDLYQDNVVNIGSTYTVEYKVSNYTAGSVKALVGTTAGSWASNNGVFGETLKCAGNNRVSIRASSDFVGSIDYVKVHKNYHPVYSGKSEYWLPTLSNVSSGALTNTQFSVLSGSFKVSQSSDKKKWIECVTSGLASALQDRAFGTWVFEFLKGGDANNFEFLFIASQKASPTAAGQNSYSFKLNNTESVNFNRSINGSASTLTYTPAGYLSYGVPYLIAITRTADRTFTFYEKRPGQGWALTTNMTNPILNNATTISKYMVLNVNAGDKFRILDIHSSPLGLSDLKTLYK